MKQEFGYFLKNSKFRAALGLTLLLSYGYAIATTRVSIDSLEGDRYIGTGGVMLSTGRFGMNLWAAVLGYGRAEPSYAFGIDLLAALLLALAAVSFCALLRKAAQDRISMFGYGLFACLLVSYPLMNEIWEYSGANVCVCGGYLLDAAALNLLWDARQPGVPWRGRALRMGAAALCLMVVCSSYESLAAVFVLAVFALLTLEQLLAAERPRFAAVLTEGLWYAVALVGGGTKARPGEISLAHNGVLFLDELPEFRRDAIESMRQPLEDGQVTISRVQGSQTFPCEFMLVCAMNPCPCGWYGDPSGRCTCSQAAVDRYLSRISGPMLDRVDMIVEVSSVKFDELRSRTEAEPSSAIKARVDAARNIQNTRYSGTSTRCNAYMQPAQLRTFCQLDEDCTALMKQAFDALGMTARSYDRVLKVARTIADLAGSESIRPEHIAEAVQYRSFQLGGENAR